MREPLDHESPGVGFDRLVFLSDAVFAIAITLLVLDLRLPTDDHGAVIIGKLIPKLIGYGVSFFVTGLYWLAHHKLFQGLRGQDGPVRVVNLVFLASVVFLAFPSSVISEKAGAPWAVTFYALSVAMTGLLLVVLILVARRRSLLRPGETVGGTARFAVRSLGAPLVFLATAWFAQTQPLMAMVSWLGLAPAVWIMGALGDLVQRFIDRAPQLSDVPAERPPDGG